MRLYKMELYKICSRKLFLFSVTAALMILLLFMYTLAVDNYAMVNGVEYEGLRAVQINRTITEEFKGTLTDEKVTAIAEKYGFPNGVRENYGQFLYRNYLNEFIMKGFSDGYFRAYDNYKVATHTNPIAETDFGKASAATGKPLLLEYTYGWEVFHAVLGIGLTLGMVFILLTLSPIYSEETYNNTQQILFTTKEGQQKDIAAKIAAGMTIAVSVFVVIVLLDFLFVWSVFGLDGLDCFISQVLENAYVWDWNGYHNTSTWSVQKYLSFYLLQGFLGMIEAAALSLYFSAHCNSPFQSIVASTIGLVLPVFLNVIGQDNFRGVIFQASQLIILLLLGIALMCLVPDTWNKTVVRIGKILCCVLPVLIGRFFRHVFPFYYTIPFMLIMNGASELDFMQVHFPWIWWGIFLFVTVVTILYIVCSWRKYKELS